MQKFEINTDSLKKLNLIFYSSVLPLFDTTLGLA